MAKGYRELKAAVAAPAASEEPAHDASGAQLLEQDASGRTTFEKRALRLSVALLLALGIVVGVHFSTSGRAQTPSSSVDGAVAQKYDLASADSEELLHCGRVEREMEYMGTDIAHLPNIESEEVCCAKCQENPTCRLWMWGSWKGMRGATDGGYQTCTLRTLDPGAQLVNKVPRRGVVSGVPFNWDEHNSFFCFALMQPRSYEGKLLTMQLRKHWSMFGCEEYAVISNETFRLAPGVVTSRVVGSLDCDTGGEFGTALNTEIFSMVWRKVIDDGRWRYNDWTVKLDPDCVFFPRRLKVAVAFHPDTFQGLYLNNCKFGLHGPLEVFSMQAVSKWSTGMQTCKDHFVQLCSGECMWGEDMFIDQCFQKVLHVQRADDWNLLSELHCESHDWEKCGDHRVAFHPFKTEKKYAECVKNADYGKLPIIAG